MTALYQAYFGLSEAPFSIAPAPRFLYMSQRHQEALAHLLYGLQGEGGFVLLTGEVGTGKTTVCRSLLEQLPETCDVAYIFNPRLTVEELLSTICREFGIKVPRGNRSIKVFVDRINDHLMDLHARGRQAVLIIDEAQNLAADVLEQMRLLTNLETSERKLLQIVLLGQPELAAMLARPELRQLAQRIVARYHLGPLTRAEVAAYIRHRLEVAGTQRPLFPPAVTRQVYRLSGGIPRVINLLCDRALLGAYAQGGERVDRTILARAAREVFGHGRRFPAWRALAAGLALAAAVTLAVVVYRHAGEGAAVQADGPAVQATVATAPDTLDWPADTPRADSEALAYAALFRAWGADFRGTDWCRRGEALGMRCRAGHGGLDELRGLNRPAVLRLRDRRGGEFHATLVGLRPEAATLSVGGQVRVVPPDTLATRWTGHYSLLWRAPAALRDTVRPGDRGPAVEALRVLIARWRGSQPGMGRGEVFDDALAEEVRRFQRERGLNPDGRVGALTLAHLIGAADPAAPGLAEDAH